MPLQSARYAYVRDLDENRNRDEEPTSVSRIEYWYSVVQLSIRTVVFVDWSPRTRSPSLIGHRGDRQGATSGETIDNEDSCR